MNPNDLKCRAKDLNGNVVEGWYLPRHVGDKGSEPVIVHQIYKGRWSEWFEIDPATLELCSEPVLKVKPHEFKSYWNEFEALPRITTMTGKRKAQLKTRCEEPVFAENWELIIKKIAQSPFLTGKETNWHADVTWFLANDNNYVKGLEGKYDRAEAKGVEQRETSLDRLAREAKERE